MDSKPKLIIVNGPLGSGKSTLARMYAENHPLAVRLDIDDIWYMIGQWRTYNDASTQLAKDMAIAMARVALRKGSDVIVPQIIQTEELAERFYGLAQACGADYYEILLSVPKDEAIERFKRRNVAAGHQTGFREGGIIATNGREKKLAHMYDKMMSVAQERTQTRTIESAFGDVDATYAMLTNILKT